MNTELTQNTVIPQSWFDALSRMEQRETWTVRNDPIFQEAIKNWARFLAASSIHPVSKLSEEEHVAAAYTPAGEAIVLLSLALTPEGLTALMSGDIENAMELAVHTVTQTRLQILDALDVIENVFSADRIKKFKAALNLTPWDIEA
jgi:hypothetical protein